MSSPAPLLAIAATLLVAVSGCAGSAAEAGPAVQTATELAHGSNPAEGRPFNLYTHCGIRWANIRHTFWYAEHELSDGHGNSPEGWGNPFQTGRLTFQSRRTATFTSTAGQVIFHRSSQTQPPFICS